MKILPKEAKVDVGLIGQALNNANATGRYYHMAKYRRALAVLSDGASAATKTTLAEFLQAKDADGTGAKGIPTDAGQLAKAEIAANTANTVITCTLNAPDVGDTVTINGVTFTVAAATDAAKREFADADGLVTCITDATYGVPGVTASNAAGTVTISVIDAGETVITATTGDAVKLALAQVQAIAYVDLDVSQLDLANGFEWIAVKVTKTGNGVVAATLLRYIPRYEPDQKVGASAVV